MSIKDRLIQFVFRGKNDLSPEARKVAESLNKVREQGESLRAELDKAKDARGLAISLRATTEAAERAQTTLDRSERKIGELREALDKSPASKHLSQSLRQAERNAEKAAQELDKLSAETKRFEEAAKAAGIDTRKLSDEESRLAAEVAKAKTAIGDNSKELRDLERQQRANARASAEHTSRVDAARQSMTSAGKTVLAFAATYVSLNAALGLVRRGFDFVRSGIAGVISEGSTSEQTLAQLEAALRATGGAAGFTAEQLQLMADKLEEQSNYTAEEIIAAQTRLLSYTDVVGEQFPAALQIAIDQAQRLGISVESSAETVGKALQTPSKAMEALGRQGFKLEAGQGALLKRLEATGKMAEAQAIIMDMLNESYGGAAAAARVGMIEGLWKGLTDRIGNFYKMIGNAGALDFVKQKLIDVGDYIQQMADDGRLQRLAESLSNAFIQGVEKVEEFAKKLASVDFNQLIDDSTKWLNSFGVQIDTATTKVKLFFAPFRTLFNGVTSGFSVLGIVAASFVDKTLMGFELLAKAIPDMFGGNTIRENLEKHRADIAAFSAGLKEQILQDGEDIRNAWDVSASSGVASQKRVADAAVEAEAAKKEAAEATSAKVEELNQRFVKSTMDAMAEGKRHLVDFAEAMRLLDTAKSVDDFHLLRTAMEDAYRAGRISQEEFALGLGVVKQGIEDLGGEAATSARRIEDIINALGDFTDVQKAIKGAQTDVDINKLRSAITKLYEEGALTAKEYNKAVAELEKRQEKLKTTVDNQAGSQSNLAKQVAAVTDALNAQASAAQAAADERAQQDAVNRTSFAMFFDEVLTAARTPLAELSEKALAAFDALKGISTADIDLDTSSLEATVESLAIVDAALGNIQADLNNRFRGPFARWADETLFASRQIQKDFLTQKQSLQNLLQAYDSGSTTLFDFARNAQYAKDKLDLLEDADLQQLEGAIANAKQRMAELGDSTRNTLDGMRDELDRLRGNEEAIEKRRMAARQRELQAQMAEARAAGNDEALRNLGEAMSVLQSINNETARARRQNPEQAKAPGAAEPRPAAQQAAPSRVIRLESPRGGSVDLTVPTGQEDALLSILEQSGMRTI